LKSSPSSLTLDSQSTFDLQTIAHIVEQFLRSKKSSQTQKAYFRDIHDFFEFIQVYTVTDLKHYPIYELSSKVIAFTESYKKTDEYRKDRVLNPRTINRKAYAISSFFEYLVAHYGYPRNPIKVFTPYASPSKTSTDELSQSEFDAIWDYSMKHLEKNKQKSLKSQLTSYQIALLF
jgi:site-specific recombinase XerD